MREKRFPDRGEMVLISPSESPFSRPFPRTRRRCFLQLETAGRKICRGIIAHGLEYGPFFLSFRLSLRQRDASRFTKEKNYLSHRTKVMTLSTRLSRLS